MFKNITLEMSLKPFKRTDDEYIYNVCRKAFEQWKPLTKNAETVSVLLWTADGSEILDYRGNLDDKFEWAYFVGMANRAKFRWDIHDPEGVSIQYNPRHYTENVPEVTYRVLQKIVSTLKKVGQEILQGKKIRVGAMFDPGSEFSKSDFKYNRHNEICLGDNVGGAGTMVCSYATLHADDVHYAGFPHGIPEGLPLGTFLGKQAQIFMTDMGFDYIWFSNGFGFGRDPWSTTGAVFDGERFDCKNVERTKKIALDFWTLFRKECPNFPIETRGTNMSTGIDFSTDAIPLKDIYDGGFNLMPPPNSPWAALNYDLGLELMGHMSRIAELPGDEYMFRYYIHDPWYANSPWHDRYDSQPYDIYLPMALSRIDENGNVKSPTHLNLLTIDDSFGNMPDSCVYEPLPHLLKATNEAPDAPSPIVWIYPFREYSTCKDETLVQEMFFGDWFVRNAINDGLPLSTVVSTDIFCKTDKEIYSSSVLLSPVPEANGDYERTIINYITAGGKVIFYGSVTRASEQFKKLIGVQLTDGISGESPLIVDGETVGTIKHDSLLSGGDIDTVAINNSGFAFVNDKVVATKNDNVVWVRGTNPNELRKGSFLLIPQDDKTYYHVDKLLLLALEHFGYVIKQRSKGKVEGKRKRFVNNSVIMIHRHNGAFVFSSFNNNTTSDVLMRLPFGAPVLEGSETYFENGCAVYHFTRGERKECRVFVEQDDGVVTCSQISPSSAQYRRRIEVEGLKNATVRIIAENYCKDNFLVQINTNESFCTKTDPFDGNYVKYGRDIFYEVRNVTGKLTFSMPWEQFPPK